MPSYLSVFLFVTLIVGAFIPTITYAQSVFNNTTTQDKSLQSLHLGKPILQKLSDNKVYAVTLKSGQATPLYGLNFEIVFLNATSTNLNSPPPNAESNVTTDRQDTVGMTVPSVVEQVIPVKTFDIQIFDNKGNKLFDKTGESPHGGRILEKVDVKNYTGHITINLNNIVLEPSWNEIVKKQLNQTSNPSETIKDSVKFETEVIKS
jgi:hypothetical protein